MRQNDLFDKFYLIACVDIVGSTAYKSENSDWVKNFKKQFTFINDVFTEPKFGFFLWKNIGDAKAYIKPVDSITSVCTQLENIKILVEKINDHIPELSVKAASWIIYLPSQEEKTKGLKRIDVSRCGVDIIFDEHLNNYKDPKVLQEVKRSITDEQELQKGERSMDDDVLDQYSQTVLYKSIDLIGKSIDRGFRLLDKSRKGQLVICHIILELIHFKNEKNMEATIASSFIYKFEKLKGIWNNNPYPIVFYRHLDGKAFANEFFLEEEKMIGNESYLRLTECIESNKKLHEYAIKIIEDNDKLLGEFKEHLVKNKN